MAKLNNGTLFRMATYFAAILFTAGCVYGVVHHRLNAVEGKVPNIDKNTLELVGVKKDIGYLTEKVDRNYTVQQQILTEIKEIRK